MNDLFDIVHVALAAQRVNELPPKRKEWKDNMLRY